jgi:hypothetical protein
MSLLAAQSRPCRTHDEVKAQDDRGANRLANASNGVTSTDRHEEWTMRCGFPRVVGILLCGVLLGAIVSLAACASPTASLRSCQQSVTTATSEDSTTATTIAVATTGVPTTERTITSSTELVTPPMGSDPIMWLTADLYAAGIQVRFGPWKVYSCLGGDLRVGLNL